MDNDREDLAVSKDSFVARHKLSTREQALCEIGPVRRRGKRMGSGLRLVLEAEDREKLRPTSNRHLADVANQTDMDNRSHEN
jgi:hypothetical protein